MTRPSDRSLIVAGLISGTSIDGIDVALARLSLDGREVVLSPLGALDLPYPERLRERLLAALPPNPCTAEELTQLDTLVGQAFAEAAARAIDEFGRADLIASLGQTVYHWVENGRARGTLQLGQPAWIAERTGRPVIADIRARDIAAGGHGAPLASTLDQLWLRSLAGERPAVGLNLGGIANITVVHAEAAALAYDTGPANALIDLAATQVTSGTQRSDLGGAIAARGEVRTDLLKNLLADPYYAAPAPKSTGKEYFHADYLAARLRDVPRVSDEDLLATLTELTAVTVADECARHRAGVVVASGGGVENPTLMRALAARLSDADLRTSDELGLPRAAKEAYLTALLGWLTWNGHAANLPSATGAAGPRLLGSITPGAYPAASPPPIPVSIDRLRIAPPGKTG